MLGTILAILFFLLGIVFVIWAIVGTEDNSRAAMWVILGFALIFVILGYLFQTYRIIPTQYVGITRNLITQTLKGPTPAGLVSKPFFGSVYNYPAASSFERCETYTPAIKGSYGINLDLCFYYDTGYIDWLKEINTTGSLDANYIMAVWRNSIVGDVARSVKSYTPEALSDNRAEVETSIYDNVAPWFNERGIPLVRVSFKNWEFSSAEVAASFDASIVSQRKITEQTALFEAAKISRERETYEAETARLVAEKQKEALTALGLDGDAAVSYLWIKALSDGGKMPDVLVLGTGNTPVSIPLQNTNVITQ